jgi:UDP:flavonoid glycosyltransferase YjiC (YdhE family)
MAPVIAEPLGVARAALGLPADPELRRMAGSPYLTLTPPALEEPGDAGPAPIHRFRDKEASPAAASLTDPWPGGTDPLVYVSFGSVAGDMPYFPALNRDAIDALAPLPVRVLMTTGHGADPDELGPLPANVRAERWVPQADVLAHAAAMVCHGGYGSTLGALRRGVPLVIVPLFSIDQWANARRVAAIGAGIALTGAPGAPRGALDFPGADVTGALPDAVRRVLDDPGYGLAARRIAAEMAALRPIDEAVGVLEALAAAGEWRAA